MLKLNPDPTFTSKVDIPTPTGVQTIKVEYKYMDVDEYNAFIKKEGELNRTNEEALMDIMAGWHEVDTEFSKEALTKLCKKYHAAARVLVEKFISDLTQAKAGN
jgi:hypothetical protein